MAPMGSRLLKASKMRLRKLIKRKRRKRGATSQLASLSLADTLSETDSELLLLASADDNDESCSSYNSECTSTASNAVNVSATEIATLATQVKELDALLANQEAELECFNQAAAAGQQEEDDGLETELQELAHAEQLLRDELQGLHMTSQGGNSTVIQGSESENGLEESAQEAVCDSPAEIIMNKGSLLVPVILKEEVVQTPESLSESASTYHENEGVLLPSWWLEANGGVDVNVDTSPSVSIIMARSEPVILKDTHLIAPESVDNGPSVFHESEGGPIPVWVASGSGNNDALPRLTVSNSANSSQESTSAVTTTMSVPHDTTNGTSVYNESEGVPLPTWWLESNASSSSLVLSPSDDLCQETAAVPTTVLEQDTTAEAVVESPLVAVSSVARSVSAGSWGFDEIVFMPDDVRVDDDSAHGNITQETPPVPTAVLEQESTTEAVDESPTAAATASVERSVSLGSGVFDLGASILDDVLVLDDDCAHGNISQETTPIPTAEVEQEAVVILPTVTAAASVERSVSLGSGGFDLAVSELDALCDNSSQDTTSAASISTVTVEHQGSAQAIAESVVFSATPVDRSLALGSGGFDGACSALDEPDNKPMVTPMVTAKVTPMVIAKAVPMVTEPRHLVSYSMPSLLTSDELFDIPEDAVLDSLSLCDESESYDCSDNEIEQDGAMPESAATTGVIMLGGDVWESNLMEEEWSFESESSSEEEDIVASTPAESPIESVLSLDAPAKDISSTTLLESSSWETPPGVQDTSVDSEYSLESEFVFVMNVEADSDFSEPLVKQVSVESTNEATETVSSVPLEKHASGEFVTNEAAEARSFGAPPIIPVWFVLAFLSTVGMSRRATVDTSRGGLVEGSMIKIQAVGRPPVQLDMTTDNVVQLSSNDTVADFDMHRLKWELFLDGADITELYRLYSCESDASPSMLVEEHELKMPVTAGSSRAVDTSITNKPVPAAELKTTPIEQPPLLSVLEDLFSKPDEAVAAESAVDLELETTPIEKPSLLSIFQDLLSRPDETTKDSAGLEIDSLKWAMLVDGADVASLNFQCAPETVKADELCSCLSTRFNDNVVLGRPKAMALGSIIQEGKWGKWLVESGLVLTGTWAYAGRFAPVILGDDEEA